MSILDTIKSAVFGKFQGDPRELRKKKGLNQSEFWSVIGVTQSGGSRYESGRNIPKPVAELVRLHHCEEIDTTKLTGDAAEVVRLMQSGELRPSMLIKQKQKGGA